MQQTSIPDFIAGEVAGRVPLIGNTGQIGLECFRKASEVVRLEQGTPCLTFSRGTRFLGLRWASNSSFRLSLTS